MSADPDERHDGSVERFAKRRATRRAGLDPDTERAKVARNSRALRVVQLAAAAVVVLGVGYVSLALWERGRVMPMLGLMVAAAVAVVRIFRGTM